MLKYFTILLALVSANISAQEFEIKKVWVGDNLEYIKIDSQRVTIEVFGCYAEQMEYYLSGDTLRLYRKYTTSKDNYSKQHVKNYDFLVAKLTDTCLILVALDSNSLGISGGRKKIDFRERHLVRQPTMSFEIIKFKATGCFGTCPEMTLQIDKEKKMKFIGGSHAAKKGFYTATLSDSLFHCLMEILKLSELDKLKTWEQHVSDAPEYTVEIHYNNRVQYLKNFFLPAVTEELLVYLLDISRKVQLTESKEPFIIGFSLL